MYILKKWEKEISSYNRLSIDQAQKLYMEMERSSGKKREELRTELITGTLYLIPKFINKTILPYIKNNSFDMCDIINTCNEIWINIIDDGKLLMVPYFNRLYNEDFYNCICNTLVPEYDLNRTFGVHKEFFINALLWYVNKSGDDIDITYDDFVNYMGDYLSENGAKIYDVLLCECPIDTYNLLMNVYDYFKKIKLTYENLSYRQIRLLIDMILDSSFYKKKNLVNVSDECFSDTYVKSILEKEICGVIFNEMDLKDRAIEILKCRYGIDNGDDKTLKATGDRFNITRAGANVSVKRTMKRIKENGNKILPLINDYFSD